MKNVKTIDVVITGGFHSQTVTEILKDRGVSYIVITPNVTDGVELAEQTYHSIVKEQSKISFQTMASLVTSLSVIEQIKLLLSLKIKENELIEIYGKESVEEAKHNKQVETSILQNIDGTAINLSVLLESDEAGDVKTRMLEIIKERVGDSLKEKVTAEVVNKIRKESLNSLLKDKDNLKKIIKMLSENNILKQAINVLISFIGNPAIENNEKWPFSLLNFVKKTTARSGQHSGISFKKSVFVDYDPYDNEYINILVKRNGEISSLLFDQRQNKFYIKTEKTDDKFYGKEKYSKEEDIEKKFNLNIQILKNNNRFKIESNDGKTEILVLKKDDIIEIVSSLKSSSVSDDAEKSLDIMKEYFKGSDVETIYIDEDFVEEKIINAVNTNKLLIIYPLSKKYDLGNLSIEEKYALYRYFAQKLYKIIYILQYDKRSSEQFKFAALQEFIKNAIVHGNLADLSKPIYVKYDKNGFAVYNAHHNGDVTSNEMLSIAAAAGLSGGHIGLNNTKENAKQYSLVAETSITNIGGMDFYKASIASEKDDVFFAEFKPQVSVRYKILEDKYIHIFVNENNNIYQLRFDPRDKDFYIYSVNGEFLFENSSQEKIEYKDLYNTPEKIEKLLNLKINISNGRITVKSKDGKATLASLKEDNIHDIVSKINFKKIVPSKEDEDVLNTLKESLDIKDKDVKTIYMDEDPSDIHKRLKELFGTEKISNINEDFGSKLLVVYPFSNVHKEIEKLSFVKKCALYMYLGIKIRYLMDSNWFPAFAGIKDFELRNIGSRNLQEFIKNAIVHGNLADLSKPIYIKYDKDGFTVYNAYHEGKEISKELLNISAVAGFTGYHQGIENAEKDVEDGSIYLTPEKHRITNIGGRQFYAIKTLLPSKIQFQNEPKKVKAEIKTKKIQVDIDYDANIDMYVDIILKRKDDVCSLRYSTIADRVFVKTINENHYILNGDNKKEIEEEFNIEIINSDDKKTLTLRSNDENMEIYILKQQDVFETLRNLKFSRINTDDDKRDLDILKEHLKLEDSDIETIYLDGDILLREQKTAAANKENKLLVVYPFSRNFDIAGLTIKEKWALYKRFVQVFDSMKRNWIPSVQENDIVGNLESAALQEFIKNAIIHGNLGDLSKPIYLKYNKNGFTVYNVHQKEEPTNDVLNISAVVGLSGEHKGINDAKQAEAFFSVTSEDKRITTIGDEQFYVIGIIKRNPFWHENGFEDIYDLFDRIEESKKLDPKKPQQAAELEMLRGDIGRQLDVMFFGHYNDASSAVFIELLKELDSYEFEFLSESLQAEVLASAIDYLNIEDDVNHTGANFTIESLIDVLNAILQKKEFISDPKYKEELFANIINMPEDFEFNNEQKDKLYKLVKEYLDIFTPQQRQKLNAKIDNVDSENVSEENMSYPWQNQQTRQTPTAEQNHKKVVLNEEMSVEEILDSMKNAVSLQLMSLENIRIVTKNIVAFISSDKNKKEDVVRVLNRLMEIFSDGAVRFFPEEIRKIMFAESMNVIKRENYLSQEEKITLLVSLSRHIGFFIVVENLKEQAERANGFFDDCFKLIEINMDDYTDKCRELAYNLFDTAHFYSQDRLNALVEFLLNKEMLKPSYGEADDEKTLIYVITGKAPALNRKNRNKVYSVAINYLSKDNNIEKQGFNIDFILECMVVNFSLLTREQRTTLVSLALERSSVWQEVGKGNVLNVLVQLLRKRKYLSSIQLKDICQKLDEVFDKTDIPSDILEEILEQLTYDEFEILGAKIKNKVINYGISELRKMNFSGGYPINKNVINLVRVIFTKKEFLNREQIENLYENIKIMPEEFGFNMQEKFRLYELVYANIDLFSQRQREYIEKVVKSFGVNKFSSIKIENIFFTQLVKKIKNISNRAMSKYTFLKIKNLSLKEENRKKTYFQNYKKLEKENLKALKMLVNLSSKADLQDIKKTLMEMFSCYEKLVPNNVSKTEVRYLKNIIDRFFEQENIDIDTQRELHQYKINTIFGADLKDITLNDLINVVHQTSINYFKKKMDSGMKEDDPYGNNIQEAVVLNFAKDGYINPGIHKLLSKIEMLGYLTISFDEETLVISVVPMGDHSITIVVNTGNVNRGMSFSFYDNGMEYRAISLEKMLQFLGFETERNLSFVSAKLDKTNGVTDDTDLTEIFNTLMKIVYITINHDENKYILYGIEDYTKKHKFAVDNNLYGEEITDLYELASRFYEHVREEDIFDTVDNLNMVLKDLGLPEIPENSDFLYEEPKTHIKFLGQRGIDRYFNKVIERAFCEGRIVIDENGNLVRNESFEETENIKDLINNIDNENILEQATIVDELDKQNGQIFSLETKTVVGQLQYQEGYLQLSTGEYIFVKVLKNTINAMIRYASAESITTDGHREILTSKILAEKMLQDGYKFYVEPRAKAITEKETFKKELINREKATSNVSKEGRLLGGKTRTVVGKVVFDASEADSESILFKEFLSPEDMTGTLQAKGVVLTSGMELSHQGLIVKEKGIPATIITGVIFVERNGKTVAEIRYTEKTGKEQNINGVEVTNVVEKTIIINEGNEISIDGQTGRVIIFNGSLNRAQKKEYQQYKQKEAQEASSMSHEPNVSTTKANRGPVTAREISNDIEKYVKDFDEPANKDNFGTKAMNLHEMTGIVNEIRELLNVDMKVPFGIMIGPDAFLNILQKKNKNFKILYHQYMRAVEAGDGTEAWKAAEEIRTIIGQVSKQDLTELTKIINKKIAAAKKKVLIGENATFAVRSAFKNEDGKEFSAAGVGESKVGVASEEIVNNLIDVVLMSMFSERSVAYQCENRQAFEPAALVQVAVDSEKSAVMTVKDGKILISGSWGQGEIVVSGEKAQSKVYVQFEDGNKIDITDYITERQEYQYGLNGDVTPVSDEDSTREIFSVEDIINLSKVGIYLRDKYGYDSDIEIAMEKGTIYVVQIRPITEKQEPIENEAEIIDYTMAVSVAEDEIGNMFEPILFAIQKKAIQASDEIKNMLGIEESLIIAKNEQEAKALRAKGFNAVYIDDEISQDISLGGVVIGDTYYKETGKYLRAKLDGIKIKFYLKANVDVSKEDQLKEFVNEICNGRKIEGLENIKRVISSDGTILGEVERKILTLPNKVDIDTKSISEDVGVSTMYIRNMLAAS
ncbi:MAG: hypothetical protein II816_06360 [Elusimicrobia bacterium]|nr:hypothetical protein [Elusimicrobiota bacterium]